MASASQVRVALGALGSGCAITFIATQLLASPPKPKPCPSEKARKETFDQLAKKWDVLVRSDEFLAGIGKLRRRLIQKATGEVLEVAVGSGRNFSYYNGGKVTGITAVDFSRAMLEVADEKRKEIEPIPLRLKLASTHRLDFEDGSFDTVVDTFGICSFEQPVQALQEMRRVMKEDGQMLLLEHGASKWEFVQSMLNRGIHRHVEKYGFAWSGLVDAAKAAWIGGTELLTYGELLPAGTEKALAVMAPGLHFESPARQRHHEVALELGCGRGRAALHLFLAGATVLGVELALERYSFAVEAMQRLAHRCPEAFRVSFQTSKARLISAAPAGAVKYNSFLEVRHGDFFQLLDEEIAAATLIFLQVFAFCLVAQGEILLGPFLTWLPSALLPGPA